MSAVVEVTSLSKRFGSFVAVDNLSFSLQPGMVTGFLGPNGAGKTTTLRMLLGLIEPTSGEALIFGKRYREVEEVARHVGSVLEAADFHPGRSGRDHLRTLARSAGIEDGRADEVLELVGLTDAGGRRVKSYSLGMRQRLGLAAAMLGDPELLILDEPANGLDPEGVRWLRDFLRSFAALGNSVLVSSHVLAEVAQTVDRVAIINNGRLVVESPLDELTARIGGAVRVRTPETKRLSEALGVVGLESRQTSDDLLFVYGTGAGKVGDVAFENSIRLHELVEDSSSLEEVFLELTGRVGP